ncbi:trifunctional serine/threonine-protein kinase/ATP-binding protein/sensor histidine kinase [Cupriavidus consociatus]|uniref:trifunctional serine/threonine-protein kinase/ATP-binding protein/sensor histidine kinase n=1 Tax=Cupriavidus consociatus TaxID=2821357 RepID=UPI001AE29C21|nr:MULTISPECIES: AAA family ATPase [unclassified Cupriavidus]MBP0624035.1 AAA family ATPase [Cupriavidus sp. LEh25]MDK2660745.1 AAA family ATPase [Cupriavidus sp. LEh21]
MVQAPTASTPQVLRDQASWDDGERVFCRAVRSTGGVAQPVLLAQPAAEHPLPATLDRLAHELDLKDELDGAWAARPVEILREAGCTMLVLEDPGGEPLSRLLGAPMEVADFLRLAIGIAAALGKLHRRGLVHKDLKPAHILVNCADGHARLTGFGLASRLPRERQAPEPPETIAGTLAYMAPEQTGRMNRSIDSRSDLYAMGVTLYEMLTGALPFAAADPMEWVHCHIARQPMPPGAREANIPAMISDIVLKLLAKTAEERYQTAAGVGHDLQRCLDDWHRQHSIANFPLDEDGTPDRLLIPEKLYGREREVDTLVAAFNRTVSKGVPELVLVSGYSGIGKSSVVNELHKVLVPPRGLFASGKFDQYKRDIPYSTLVQAFQGLVRPLLGKRDTELASWRAALLEALEPNARLMTDLIPELKLIIGEPPPVPILEPQQAQRRFLLVFRRFISVFARAEHPLALFLDDLQWLDVATLDLLEDLLTGSDLRHLMLIGAYRDNEVDATHPLMVKLQAIRNAGIRIEAITLAPLASVHITQLINEALHCEPGRIEGLAQLVHNKTGGNPFFVIQFLHALVEENLLAFDHDARQWRWDSERIHAKGYTDNVVDLMAGKLTRLPAWTQQAMQQLACLGNVAGVAALSTVLGMPEAQVHVALWDAIRQELVERQETFYAFVHDRVHEAAYSLIPEASRADAHLRIGRLLAAQTPPERREEAIFEITGQLNRGAALITAQDERQQLAEFNLLAGQRAKASTAYASALTYLVSGADLLDDECWQSRHDLRFALELNRAECEFLTGQLSVADERLAALSERATNMVEKALVACLQLDVYLVLDRSDRAVEVCLAYLRHVGIEWSPHPDDNEVRHEYDRIWSQLGDRTIEELVDLPLMEDAASLGTVEALSKLFAPALQTDANLACLTICKAVSLSLERGNCDASCVLYANVGRVAGRRFGDHQAGYRFGLLGCELVDRRGLKRFEAKTFLCFSIFVVRWLKPVKTCRELLRRAFAAANRIGDLPYGAYAGNSLNSDLLFAGEPLAEVQREAERGLAYAEKVRFGLVIDFINTQLALVRMLRGLTPRFGCLDDKQFEESETEAHLAGSPDLALAECWYWTRKLQACYLAGDYASAMAAAAKAQPLLWTSSSFFEEAEYHYYGALTHAAWCDFAPVSERTRHLEAMAAHHRDLQIWAQHCPDNFADRATLVAAEIARVTGNVVEAEHFYEQAIHAAQESGFVHSEALANELASRFYAARGLKKIARVYLQDARYGYLRWGADGKVRQLEESYPYLRTEETAPGPTSTMATPVEHLDLATVLKVSQAASGDIVLDNLIDMVMRTAIEQAGAERGLLILADDGEHRIAAEATTGGGAPRLQLRNEPVSAAILPESVLYHVLRTRESIVLDDAASEPSFEADPYIRQHCARSILCMPLMNQAKLTGALYLENNLTARVFSPARIAVLKLVASQASSSLENARLYRDLAEREAKIRRLVDANIIGIIVWNAGGDIIEANDAFLRMVGYEREDLISGRVRWTDLTPEELRADSEQALAHAVRTGSALPFEKEYIRKDGSRLPVIVGLAMFADDFADNRKEGVAFVLDLTERKQAEERVRESERRYRDVQTELAHANRLATMGQLTASIAHEVNQPIAATVTNAEAALRWLGAQPPDIDEVGQVLGRIIKDTNRAGDVLRRIRELVRKAPPRKEPVDINEAIREVIELTRGETAKSGAEVQTRLADGLPLIEGDRVELQQVLLNLIINALEAMREVSDGVRELRISSEEADAGCVLVTVRDSGPGFESQSAEQAFAPFYTTKPTGLGMGLSICRSIIDTHGGELSLGNGMPHGAVVRFTVLACRDAS